MNKTYKNFKKSFTVFICVIFAALNISAQTTHIGPANGGNFDLGSTFTANNWLVVNGPNANINHWVVGTQPTGFTGNSAYITANAAGVPPPFSYTNTTTTSSTIYRDVTFPSGETNINLSFNWRGLGETGGYDQLTVFVVPTTMTPTTSAPTGAGNSVAAWGAGVSYVAGIFVNQNASVQSATLSIPASIAGNCASASTMRICFNFKCDGSGGSTPAFAIDNVLLTSVASGIPLSGGTYTINNTLATSSLATLQAGSGNYNSFNEAINDLNAVSSCGVFTGPVTFNVSAGQTFNTDLNPITAIGNSTNQITFQKAGVGANPVITPPNGLGIYLWGADYINFDGINVNASSATLAGFGIFLRNFTSTNGCQFNTFKNFNVTMNQALTTTYGVLTTSNTSIGAGVIPTSAAGANSNNSFQNFTIENTYNGIRFECGTTTVANQDQNNTVGVTGVGCQTTRNTIRNLGGNTTSPIICQTSNQNNLKVFNTDIYNATHTTTFSTLVGMNLVGTTGTSDIYNNKIYSVGVTNTGTATVVGMSFTQGTGTGSTNSDLRIYNNSISGLITGYTGVASTTVMQVGMQFPSVTGSLTTHLIKVDNNSVSFGTATNILHSNVCFRTQGTTVGANGLLTVKNNIFANATAAQVTAKHYCYNTAFTTGLGQAGSTASYNDCYVANATNGFVGWRGTISGTNEHASVSAFNTALAAFASNNLNTDPIFANDATDLHNNASAVNNVSGATHSAHVTFDVDCNSRGVNVDLGVDDFTPVTNDLSVVTLLTPAHLGATIGGNPTQTVIVRVKNLGTAAIDFSIDPVTVNITMGGVGSGSLSGTLSTGVINQGQTADVTMSTTYNMTTAGTHTFASTLTWAPDGVSGNNSATYSHQVRASYGIVKSAAAYNSIIADNSGTVFTNILAPSFTADDEGVTEVIPLTGTTFQYFGQPITGFRATANGVLTFNTAYFATSFTPNFGTNNLFLSPHWQDMAMLGSTIANKDNCMRYKIVGTLGSGTAQIIMEWANMEGYTFSPPNLNFQIVLKEAGNVIEYNYGQMQKFDGSATGIFSTGAHHVGMSGAAASGGTLADRIIQQRANENFWGTASTPIGTAFWNPECNTRLTFTYNGLPSVSDPGAVGIPTNDAATSGDVATVATLIATNNSPCLNNCGNFYKLANATATTGITACSPAQGNPDDDVWFRFTTSAIENYKIQVNPNGAFDVVVQLFDNTLTQVGTCQNAAGTGLTEILQTPSLAGPGVTYYVRVYAVATGNVANGEFSICVSEFVPPPANDECLGAITLTPGVTCTPTNEPVNILGATQSASIPVCSAGTPGNADDDVFYKFTTDPTPGLTYTITLQSNVGYNGVLQLLSGACGSLAAVNCVNATGTAGIETISSSSLTPSTTYTIRVYHSGAGVSTGDYSICVQVLDLTAPAASLPTRTPSANQCTPTARTIGITLQDYTGVASASIVWTKNGVAQANIPMSLFSGSINNGVWQGTIPAQAIGDAISYTYSFVDLVSPTANSGTNAGGSYTDGGPSINAGADISVNVGNTATLTATHSLQGGCVKITEITLFRTGTGQTPTYPAYATGQDLVEITNTSATSVDISGWHLKVEGAATIDYTFAGGTTIPANSVAVICLGTGTDDIVNRYYNTGTPNDVLFSGAILGVWLTDGSTVKDAVAVNSHVFTMISGVSNTQWSGAGAPALSGEAGTRLTAPDANNNTGWQTAGLSTQNIGTLNPGIGSCSIVAADWTGGNLGGPITADQITTPVFGAPGTFTFTASVTDGTPCTTTDNVVVTAVTPTLVTTDFTGAPLVGTTGGITTTHTFTPSITGGIADTYNWTFTPNNVVYVNGTSASSPIPQVQFTASGTYTVALTAGNLAGNDTETKTNYVSISVLYCQPQFTQTFAPPQGCGAGDMVNTLNITYLGNNVLNNANTGCNGNPFAYILYPNNAPGINTCNLARGASYTVNISNIPGYDEGYGLWLDKNSDGDFSDPGEFIGANPVPANSVTFTINIPFTATLGPARLRVIAKYLSTLTAGDYCTTGLYGETEDYTVTITPPIPPQNNNCTFANILNVNNNSSCLSLNTGTLLAATLSPGYQVPCVGNADDDVWFRFVATNPTHQVTLTQPESEDLVTMVYTACNSAVLSCNDPETFTLNNLVVGNTYYLRIFSKGSMSLLPGAGAEFTICVNVPIPANDEPDGALTLPVTSNGGNPVYTTIYTISATNTAAPAAPDPDDCSNSFGDISNDIWYAVTVPSNGSIAVNVDGTSGTLTDGDVAIYIPQNNTSPYGTLTLAGCDGDGGSLFRSHAYATGLTPGNTVLIRLGAYDLGTSGSKGVAIMDGMYWTGNTSTSFTTMSNWFGTPDGFSRSPFNFPTQYNGVVLRNLANDPAITSTVDVGSVDNFGSTPVTITGASNFLQVRGSLRAGSGAANYSGTGAVRMQSNNTQISGLNTFDNLRVNVGGGNNVTIPAGTFATQRVQVYGVYTPESGTLTTNHNGTNSSSGLFIRSNSTKTGQIAAKTAIPPVNGSFVGPVSIERFVPASAFAYQHYIASPITESNSVSTNYSDDFTVAGTSGYVYDADAYVSPAIWPTVWWYDETYNSANASSGYKSATAPYSMSNGNGVVARINGSTPIDVIGTPADYLPASYMVLPITKTLPTRGDNILGNPFPSTLDLNVVWTGRGAVNQTQYTGSYFQYKPASNTFGTWDATSNSGINGGVRYMGHSASCFIKAQNAAVGLEIDNSMATTAVSGAFFESNQVSPLKFQVEDTNSPYSVDPVTGDITGTGFEMAVLNGLPSSATDGYDANIDVPFLAANPALIAIYSKVDNQNISINKMGPLNGNKVIDLGVVIPQGGSGSWTFKITDMTSYVNDVIKLEDTQTGIMYNLTTSANNSVTFTGLPVGNQGNRFKLHINPSFTSIKPILNSAVKANELNIFTNGNKLFVNFGNEDLGNTTLEVVNLLGQTVLTQNASTYRGVKEFTVNNAVGNYIVRVTTPNKTVTEKVFFERK
jgi:hypothetical protein